MAEPAHWGSQHPASGLRGGKEDRVYAGFELLEELERKANALEAYCLKKISAEFEKKGL
jgi:hypothetical protein